MTPIPAFWAEIAITVGAGLILGAATLAGAAQALGAHPWWAVQTGLIGAGGGLVLYAVLRFTGLRAVPIGLVAALTLTLSSLSAVWGKQAFSASFAEDALAGRMWYFGWFGIAGSATIVLTVFALRLIRR